MQRFRESGDSEEENIASPTSKRIRVAQAVDIIITSPKQTCEAARLGTEATPALDSAPFQHNLGPDAAPHTG
jgi:hypothetical protein